MKKYFLMLLSMMFAATMCVGFVSCGDDDEDIANPNADSNGSSSSSEVAGKFQGPKRVFGNNLLNSYGSSSSLIELTYNSDDFVTELKGKSTSYKVSYSDNQVIVTEQSSTNSRQYIFTIGSNGFAESYTSSKVGGGGNRDVVKFEYDSEGHLIKITATEDDDRPWIGTFTWQDGNLIKANDNDSWSYKSQSYTYGSINNIAGLFVTPNTSGDIGDFYKERFHYIGLLGKGTKNLVKSYSKESRSGENTWTLDAAGRPTKCVTTSTSGNSSSSTTYVWNYR